MPSGNLNLRNVSERGYQIERFASKILESEGFKIISEPENEKQRLKQNDPRRNIRKKINELEFCNEWREETKHGHILHRDFRKLTPEQKNELARLKQTQEKLQNDKDKKLREESKILKILGKLTIPKINETDWKEFMIRDAKSEYSFFSKMDEQTKTKILEYLIKRKPVAWIKLNNKHIVGGIQEIEKLRKQNPQNQGHGYWGVGDFHPPSYIDYFCKRDGKYFLIDVKHKTFNQNKTMNQFSVTNTEVLNYDRIMKGKMVVVKILIVLEKDHKLFYKMCDWNDFTRSKNYDPHKTRKTIIRLKDGFDISKLIKF